jgi:hypothetical protein
MRKGLLFFVTQVALIVLFIGTPLGLYASIDLSPWWIGGPALVVGSLAAMSWAVYGFRLLYRADPELAGKVTMNVVYAYFAVGLALLVLFTLGVLP